MSIGTDIRRIREALHLTQAEFAERMGVKNYYIYRWEKGVIYPNEEHRALLVAMFGLDRRYLTEQAPSVDVDAGIKRRKRRRKRGNG